MPLRDTLSGYALKYESNRITIVACTNTITENHRKYEIKMEYTEKRLLKQSDTMRFRPLETFAEEKAKR